MTRSPEDPAAAEDPTAAEARAAGVDQSDDDHYSGAATVAHGGGSKVVRVRLSGRLEPTDGHYHWGGTVAPDEWAADAFRARAREVTLRIGDGPARPVRLTEVNPWGGVGLAAIGARPWPIPVDKTEPTPTPEPATTGAATTEPATTGAAAAAGRDVDVAVIGAGFGGLGAAIQLVRHGHRDFLVFDRADDVGGTWRDNTYPGCACDVPSHLYSFSFASNPAWSDTFSGQAEIHRYLRGCVRRFGLADRLRLGHELLDARWDEAFGRWRLRTSGGRYTARVLIGATGPFDAPAVPELPGLDAFEGTVFHSARWRHDHDLTGRRVAVIGTGASAVQFVPEIQPVVGALTLFQRTPPWVLPRRSRAIGEREHAVYRSVPGMQRLLRTALYWGREATGVGFWHPRLNRLAQRLSEQHLRRQVADPELRAKLTPRYTMGCKRVLLSNDYWPALTRENVTLVTDAIERITPTGVRTADGVDHPVDTIIMGTGFRVTDPPFVRRIHGRDGRSLTEAFTPTMRAYAGTTVPGFPNLFLLLGPNTGLGHTSVILMIENQLRYVLGALAHMRRHRVAAIEPTERAEHRSVAQVDARMRGTVWTRGGCDSWYLDAGGRNATLWPGYVTAYRLRSGRFRAADHIVLPQSTPTGADATTEWIGASR